MNIYTGQQMEMIRDCFQNSKNKHFYLIEFLSPEFLSMPIDLLTKKIIIQTALPIKFDTLYRLILKKKKDTAVIPPLSPKTINNGQPTDNSPKPKLEESFTFSEPQPKKFNF